MRILCRHQVSFRNMFCCSFWTTVITKNWKFGKKKPTNLQNKLATGVMKIKASNESWQAKKQDRRNMARLTVLRWYCVQYLRYNARIEHHSIIDGKHRLPCSWIVMSGCLVFHLHVTVKPLDFFATLLDQIFPFFLRFRDDEMMRSRFKRFLHI